MQKKRENRHTGRKRDVTTGSAYLDLENLPSMDYLLGDQTPQAGTSNPNPACRPAASDQPKPPDSKPPSRNGSGRLQLHNMPSMSELLSKAGDLVVEPKPKPLVSSGAAMPRHQARQTRTHLAAEPKPTRWQSEPRARGKLPNQVIIDGSNVCRRETNSAYGSFEEASSLTLLLKLTLFLVENNIRFRCLFDASERFTLSRNGEWPHSSAVYGDLLRHGESYFYEVPAGQSADELILEQATRKNCAIISNDRFNKIRDGHIAKYPWLMANSKRLVRAQSLNNGATYWPELGLKIFADGDPAPLADELLARIS